MWTMLALSILITISPELRSQNKDFWVNQLKSLSVDLRINALQKLKELRYPDTVNPISRSLQDQSSEVRFHAVRALTNIATKDAKSQLKSQLNVESDPYLKSEIRRGIRAVDAVLKKQAEEAAKALEKAKEKAKAKP